MIENGTFRVYSRSWTEGEDGYVFIDDDTGDAVEPVVYYGTVQPGGYLQITPLPGELPATGAAWYVSVADDLDGTARSTWVNALQIETAGDAVSPLLVANEEDISCGGIGTECAHPILPGQTWQGEWGEAGDTDYFSFIVGAGVQVNVTLERVDTTLPPQHPDAPGPEILLVRPDDIVFAASDPLGLDDTGTGLSATLTMDGRYVIAVRTPKGAGQYRVTLTKTAEGGAGAPAFGFTNARTHLTTTAHPEAHMRAPILDPFGNPIAGSVVSWEQGSDCGVGEFCGNGMTTTTRTTADGHAVLDVEPAQGGDPLWRPQTLLGQALKAAPLRREAVAQKIAVARQTEAVLGVLRISGDAVEASVLPDLATARAVKSQARRRAERGGKAALKDGPLCGSHADTCPVAPEPVFRAVKLALAEGEELIDLEVRILDGGQPTVKLDGHEVMSDLGLELEAVATVRDGQGAERDVTITDPIAVAVSEGAGGALSNGVATCNRLDIAPGVFTYKTGRNAVLHQAYTEPDGSPCCWAPTEVLAATVVVKAEVDDGQGGTILVTKEATTIVESIPRPADPCELRSLQPGTPQLATYDNYAAINTGTVYLTDACGNIVVGVGQNDSPNHDQPGDELRITSPLQPPGEGVWATALSNTNQWSYDLFLHGNVGTPDRIPDGLYTIDLEIASQNPQCTPGGAYTVQTTTGEPQVALWWDWIWDSENSPRGPDPEEGLISPGSAVRDRSGAVAVWRVPAYDDATIDNFFEGAYTNVPVKLYVASMGTIPFDEDGNLGATYLEPVEDVELCTGVVEKLTDSSGNLDYNSPVRTTCDTSWTTITDVVYASSDPNQTGHASDAWIPMGLGIGITKGPEQPGSYVLVAEPMDETFRRGDAWKVMSSLVPDGFVGFEVGGGMFLDEDWVPLGSGIHLIGSKTTYLKAMLSTSEPTIDLVIVLEDDGGELVSAPVTLAREGTISPELAVYVAEVVFDQDGSTAKHGPTELEGSSKSYPLTHITVPEEFTGLVQVRPIGKQDGATITSTKLVSYRPMLLRARGIFHEDGSFEAGYLSEDDQGRVYANRDHDNETNPGLSWKPDSQFVEFTAAAVPVDPDMPDSFRVQWSAEDPDDPTNNPGGWNGRPEMADGPGQVVDPNDYDVNGVYDSAEGNDNTGSADDHPTWGQASDLIGEYPISLVSGTGYDDRHAVVQTAFLSGHLTIADILDIDCKIIDGCDGVIVYVPRYELLQGGRKVEYDHAKANNIPVITFATIRQIEGWVDHMFYGHK